MISMQGVDSSHMFMIISGLFRSASVGSSPPSDDAAIIKKKRLRCKAMGDEARCNDGIGNFADACCLHRRFLRTTTSLQTTTRRMPPWRTMLEQVRHILNDALFQLLEAYWRTERDTSPTAHELMVPYTPANRHQAHSTFPTSRILSTMTTDTAVCSAIWCNL